MGKSPGKWMKTLIFGKKSSRTKIPNVDVRTSHTSWSSKPTGRNYVPTPEAYDERRDGKSESLSVDHIENTNLSLSFSQRNEEKIEDNVQSNISQDEVRTELNVQNNYDRIKEEQAAMDVQTAVRGYLARREFWTLKGIIRLQALIRGHLVRRQAISTLYCMFQIVKFQALARGINIRHSDIRVEVQNKFARGNKRVICSIGVNKSTDILKGSRNGFARKILASSPTAMPLHFQYDSNEANSVLRWLERWSVSRCWQLLPKPIAGQRSKVKTPHIRISSVSIGENIASEFDIPIRNLKKVPLIEPANIIEENPELVLEKVKRSLRKVNTTVLTETETDKKIMNDNTRKITTEKEKVAVSEVEKAVIRENQKADENVNETKKSNNEKRQKIKRSTPSYMASTVSAKAKLRGQDSPEIPTTLTRRYSMPSMKNANNSLSPRVRSTGRLKNDISLQLSRDSNSKVSVKVYQAAWRL